MSNVPTSARYLHQRLSERTQKENELTDGTVVRWTEVFQVQHYCYAALYEASADRWYLTGQISRASLTTEKLLDRLADRALEADVPASWEQILPLVPGGRF